jgi:tetratricopeptide (TPR) repeat protein
METSSNDEDHHVGTLTLDIDADLYRSLSVHTMSSSSPPSSSATASSPSESESILMLNFVTAWKSFYEKANGVVQSSLPSHKNDTKLRSILESLTTLMSGVDEPKKAVAVSHGVLVLAVAAMRKLNRNLDNDDTDTCCDNSMNVIVGLKAVKACVVRNPTGRAKCRQEGVFEIISNILLSAPAVDTETDTDTDMQMQILEETYTTLGAVCLGDDLNALKAALAYGEKVEAALKMYRREKHASLHQKLVYLQALFRAMEREQADLLNTCDNDNPSTLFQTIETAECNLDEGINREQEKNQWAQAETDYTNALHRIQFITSHTELLDDIFAKILDHRSSVRLKLQNWNGALDDADACLQGNTNTTTKNNKHLSSAGVVTALHARRSDALHQLGRMQEAGQALDKALAISPKNKTLLSKINRLQLAKIKSCKQQHSSFQRRRRQTNETDVAALESWLALAGRRQDQEQQCLPRNDRVRHRRQHQQQHHQQQQCMCTIPTAKHGFDFAPRLGASVKSLYGTGIVQEVRKCGTTKIQLESWSPGAQQPTAYLMPEFYTVVVVSE